MGGFNGDFYGGLMGFYGDLMGFKRLLMVIDGEFIGFNGDFSWNCSGGLMDC